MDTVVIVDDQAINLKILSRFALAVGDDIDVHPFTAPEEALAFLTEQKPDLIVTDFVMPTMSGESFIRRCREHPSSRDTPIIVVTAFEDRDYRYRALDAGASDFLISPVDGREFCIRARNLLELRRHQNVLRRRACELEGELEASQRQHAADVEAREKVLRDVINTVPALISASDAEGRIVFMNEHHTALFSADPLAAVGARKASVLGQAYGLRHESLDREVLTSSQMLRDVEETLVDRHGRKRILLTTKVPLRRTDGSTDQVVTVSLDITQRKEIEQAVKESEQRFRSLIEGSMLGIVIERNNRALFANDTFARMFGYDTPEAILALPSLDVLVPASSDHARQWQHQGAAENERLGGWEIQGQRKDGSIIWIEMMRQPVQWKGVSAVISTVADITLRKAYEERLQRQANFDELTSLPNRVLALDRLRVAVVGAVRHRHKGAVLFIDLDNFKKINDTLGHAVGDSLLTMAAERLRGCVREEDTVARLGGDEFMIVLPNIGDASNTQPVIQKILNAFSQPFRLGLQEAFVTASLGIAIFPDDSDVPSVLMQHADAAMYQAKVQGRNTFQFFTPAMNKSALDRMRIESHLVHALDRNEFTLSYQPIVDVASRQLVAVEALLRWSSPQLGLATPAEFLAMTEDTGLIVPIGAWVIETACRQLKRWHQQGLPHLVMAINVSARQLRGRALIDAVATALERHKAPPQAIELEITEGCLMQDVGGAHDTLAELGSWGIRVALDDFGTGYSCLSHLKDLPVDTVKVDKSFVLNVTSDAGSSTVVEAIIAMAHRLGLRVVAEGVETPEQYAFINDRGCDLAQGTYISAPLAASSLMIWLDEWRKAMPAPPRQAATPFTGRR